ncbi:hypothetical protein AB0I49_26700 [Streptomyces sp. NPDC050617]|uniref:hypothetical protein n=1 Tax=Streptomyces sp. NPDC050617 TaxID=3154628 RepID=UPI003434794A
MTMTINPVGRAFAPAGRLAWSGGGSRLGRPGGGQPLDEGQRLGPSVSGWALVRAGSGPVPVGSGGNGRTLVGPGNDGRTLVGSGDDGRTLVGPGGNSRALVRAGIGQEVVR